MDTYNRKNQLKKIHIKRKQSTEDKVKFAINKLLEQNISINFNSISNESGVSKSTLYNNKNLKNMIKNYRDNGTDISLVKMNSNNNNYSGKDINSILSYIENIESENKRLKKQIDLLYSYIFDIL